MADVLIAAIARMAGGAAAEVISAQCADLDTSRLMLFTTENADRSADTPRVDYLKSIGISSDAAEYYNIAIDEGRSVITYKASAEEAPVIEERFRTCGFVRVRRFPLADILAGAVR